MPVKKKNNKMTINDLAVIVKRSFDHADKRFDKIEKKVTDNTIRLDAMHAKLNNLDRRVMYIEDRLTEVVKQNKKEFDKIKKDLKEIKSQKIINKKQLFDLEKRIKKLELKAI